MLEAVWTTKIASMECAAIVYQCNTVHHVSSHKCNSNKCVPHTREKASLAWFDFKKLLATPPAIKTTALINVIIVVLFTKKNIIIINFPV